MIDGAPRALTGGATHYHTVSGHRRLVAGLCPHDSTIGMHHFYRSQSAEPARGTAARLCAARRLRA